jgi:glycosyltransferase involved in cell wall biosynthesis
MPAPLSSTPASAAISSPRLLFVQHSSIFAHYGGVEYYLDDIVSLASETYGREAVCSLIPQRSPLISSRPYQTQFVSLAGSGWRRKWQNRFAWALLSETRKLIRTFRPTAIINSHVSLGPLVWAATRGSQIPWWTIVYGIEAWGNLWPQDEWALQHSSGIISISHWTKKILVDRGYSPSQIEIIQPPLPDDFGHLSYHPSSENRPFTCLTISRLDAKERYKGQDHVLKALAKLRRFVPSLSLKYIIQGDGSDRSRLETLCRELALEDWVTFRSAVKDRKELEATYRSADLFVMPSRFGRWDGSWKGEGFGIVYLEAAAFGVPSLAYDCGGVTDIIVDGENGFLVPPDDIDALAEGILRLAQNRSMTREMGKKAHERVMRDFTRRKIQSQLTLTCATLALRAPT